MQGRSVAAIWLGGIALAVVIYLVGPTRFVWELRRFTDGIADQAALLFGSLARLSFDLLQALAIALFAVFVGLTIVAVRRGVAGRLLPLVVIGGFLALVGQNGFGLSGFGPSGFGSAGRHGWVGAFLLSAVGAGLMTRRLTRRG